METYDIALTLIKKHEGCRLHPYKDTTGHITIGYGRNLNSKGLSFDEVALMLKNDIEDTMRVLGDYRWYRGLTIQRQGVIVDMAFNMGVHGLLEFTGMIEAIEAGDFKLAAKHMRESKWAEQVGRRAEEDATIFEKE